ncbi:hypothetical protein THAOC_17999, partial [Thalassiosira oceanica]
MPRDGPPVAAACGCLSPVPLQHLKRDGGVDARQADAVVDQIPHRHVPLPPGGEGGPVGGHPLVQGEAAAGRVQVERHAGDSLGRGEEGRHRVLPPRARRGAVGVAPPKVDHPLPSVKDTERGPELAPGAEVVDELLPDPLPPRRDGAVNETGLPARAHAHLEVEGGTASSTTSAGRTSRTGRSPAAGSGSGSAVRNGSAAAAQRVGVGVGVEADAVAPADNVNVAASPK